MVVLILLVSLMLLTVAWAVERTMRIHYQKLVEAILNAKP